MPDLKDKIGTEMANDNEVNWYVTSEGCYGVKVTCFDKNPFSNLPIVNNWEFGSTPIDESISIYWYRTVMLMKNHIKTHPAEVIPRLLSTKTADIKRMCQEAVIRNLSNK